MDERKRNVLRAVVTLYGMGGEPVGSGLLAEHGIGLFAISTFNTDYILVKQDDYRRALTLLESNGYQLLR